MYNISLPIKRVAIVSSSAYDSVGLETDWGLIFNAEMPTGTALNFALEQFPNVPISMVDMTKPHPQPYWVIPPFE